jgi:4-hydroxy-tetrahydrodipicolinate reductase
MDEPLDIIDVKVVHFGLGPVGSAIARLVAAREGLTSVAAIDFMASRAGRDLADVAGLGAPTGIVVEPSPVLLRDIEADIVIYAPEVEPESAIVDLEACLEAGLNVVTVFPALAYPPDEDDDDELASSIDTLATEAEVTTLAVDPSDALLGTLPLTLTALASSVDKIVVRRHAAPSLNGRLSLADWASMLAESLGWVLDDLDERDERPGIGGSSHRIVGSVGSRQVIVVEMVSEPDRTEPLLEIEVIGSPNLKLSLTGGGSANDGIAALVVNAIPRVLMAEPGLYTLSELAPVHCWTSLGLLPASDDDEDFDDDDDDE